MKKKQYSLTEFKNSVKPGSFLYPWWTNQHRWSLGSGWGSEDATLEKGKLLGYQMSIKPLFFIPDSALRLQLEGFRGRKKSEEIFYRLSYFSKTDLRTPQIT